MTVSGSSSVQTSPFPSAAPARRYSCSALCCVLDVTTGTIDPGYPLVQTSIVTISKATSVEFRFRYVLEYVRYYEHEMHFTLDGMHPTYNQVVSIGLFLTGLAIYLIQRKRAASA